MKSQVSPSAATQTEAEPEPTINCSRCGQIVTRQKHRLEVDGRWEHTFRNPAGYSFHVQCFQEAPGCLVLGEPTEKDTWFPGCSWNLAACRGCQQHLGWQFLGRERFWGLIATRLSYQR